MEDEYLDLVDEADTVIGRKLRSEVYAEGLKNYRAVNVFILNSRNELWIPRRTPHKTLYPSALDMSCAGHVASGEIYEQTLKRELMEELDIDSGNVEIRFLGATNPTSSGTCCFSKNYEIRSDTVPNYNRADFTEYFWLTPGELLNRITHGEKAKSDLPILVEKFYGIDT